MLIRPTYKPSDDIPESVVIEQLARRQAHVQTIEDPTIRTFIAVIERAYALLFYQISLSPGAPSTRFLNIRAAVDNYDTAARVWRNTSRLTSEVSEAFPEGDAVVRGMPLKTTPILAYMRQISASRMTDVSLVWLTLAVMGDSPVGTGAPTTVPIWRTTLDDVVWQDPSMTVRLVDTKIGHPFYWRWCGLVTLDMTTRHTSTIIETILRPSARALDPLAYLGVQEAVAIPFVNLVSMAWLEIQLYGRVVSRMTLGAVDDKDLVHLMRARFFGINAAYIIDYDDAQAWIGWWDAQRDTNGRAYAQADDILSKATRMFSDQRDRSLFVLLKSACEDEDEGSGDDIAEDDGGDDGDLGDTGEEPANDPEDNAAPEPDSDPAADTPQGVSLNNDMDGPIALRSGSTLNNYLYCLAVLKGLASLDPSPEKARLTEWCSQWMWLADAKETERLLKELKLTSLVRGLKVT